ncbi:MAG: hypothetical protein WA919_19670 [Coleofasciculaceae cyanobacterium]
MSLVQSFRAEVLTYFGANTVQVEELLTYNQNIFCHDQLVFPLQFPLTSEAHVATWEKYAVAAKELGVFEVLKQRLVQFRFPIQEGISQSEAYRCATRRGVSVDNMVEATGLVLKQPERLQLILHQSLAGTIPVLLTSNREDFVSLVQSLTRRNEPHPIPASMAACMVTGFNNWDRINQYRQQWAACNPSNCSETSWQAEFKRIIPQKQLYQDRFIILGKGCYSNVAAKEMRLAELQWQCLSHLIRLEHESTHYLTLRLFNSMRNNLLDEIIADYQGIVTATGSYQADSFLRFMGLEFFPDYHQGGRLQNYLGNPPLSSGSFKILQALVTVAADNLQRFDTLVGSKLRDINLQHVVLIALSYLTLEELASKEASYRIQQSIDKLRKLDLSLLK